MHACNGVETAKAYPSETGGIVYWWSRFATIFEVLAEYRGRSIGSELLARGVEWAADHGIEKIYNSLPATNDRGMEFLEDHGWETEAVRANHYRLDGDYVDEVMMATTVRDGRL